MGKHHTEEVADRPRKSVQQICLEVGSTPPPPAAPAMMGLTPGQRRQVQIEKSAKLVVPR